MRKSLLILLQIIMLAMPLFAERVDEKTAQKVGETFLKSKMPGKTDLKLDQVAYANRADFSNFYVFGGENCFVIVSADDCVKPILGYSDENPFGTDAMPENVYGWLKDYDNQIEIAAESKLAVTEEIRSEWQNLKDGKSPAAKSTVVVGPLIQTAWGQGTPYNSLCPSGSVTGCVATAMSQILKYWAKPAKGSGCHSYVPSDHPEYGAQFADFVNTVYDWGNMLNSYSDVQYSNEQKNAVATLMYHCGVAVEMNYDPRESGAFSDDVPNALFNFFGYSADAKYLYKEDYADTEWKNLIKAELDQNRPVFYAGTGNSGGHAFVCDGYRDDDYFHFNWGWNGSYNGNYYNLSNLKPSSNFTSNQRAIFGIHPSECELLPPVSFDGELDGQELEFTWSAVEGAVSYRIFHDGYGSVTVDGDRTSYSDLMPLGEHRYYMTSVDEHGEMSGSTNVLTFSLAYPEKPRNLNVSLNPDGTIGLIWELETPSDYPFNIYCNNVLVATSNMTSYTLDIPVCGNLVFYVCNTNEYGMESEPSDEATLTRPYRQPVVTSLDAVADTESATLSWSAPPFVYPDTQSATLTYGTNVSIGGFGWNAGEHTLYWMHRYPADIFSAYKDKTIYKVSFNARVTGEYQIFIYKGTYELEDYQEGCCSEMPMLPAVIAQTVKVPGTGWVDVALNEPVAFGEEDVWVAVFDPEKKKYPATAGNFTENNYGCYYTVDPTGYMANSPGVSWLIKTYVTDGTYSYNLYRDDVKIADALTETSYVDSQMANDAANIYTVKTNYYGGETQSSNKVGIAKGSVTVQDLSLSATDKVMVAQNASLTVNGNLVNQNAGSLILEDNAQLIHGNSGVQATVKKSITGYGSGNGNWYLIASPFVGNIAATPLTIGEYDLYSYDEPTHYWMNSKVGEQGEDTYYLANGTGYLYANQGGQPISLVGELQPSNNHIDVPLSYTPSLNTLRGFNLVGNPFPCKATLMGDYIAADFYVMSDDRDELVMSQGIVVNPYEGVFVEATSPESVAQFYRWNPDYRGGESSASFDITINEERCEIDRARVRMGEGVGLGKFSLNENSARIYIPMDKQDYASVYVSGRNVLPLNFKPAHNGTYTLNFDLANVNLAYLHLIDNLTGADVDLMGVAASTGSASYSFDAKTMDYTSRFKMVFAEKQQSEETDDSDFMYFAGGQMFVFCAEGNSIIQIVDATGRIVLNENVKGFVNKSLSLKPGVYVARMICGGAVKTQKFVAE